MFIHDYSEKVSYIFVEPNNLLNFLEINTEVTYSGIYCDYKR